MPPERGEGPRARKEDKGGGPDEEEAASISRTG
jgi:hypothetical protein